MKNIYLIVGPSGSGKTMVANRLEEKYRLKQVLSYTERPPRFEGEGGHTFVTPEEFDKLKNLCAYTVFDGHRYGVPAEMVEVSDIYVIDPAGVAYMKLESRGPATTRRLSRNASAMKRNAKSSTRILTRKRRSCSTRSVSP